MVEADPGDSSSYFQDIGDMLKSPNNIISSERYTRFNSVRIVSSSFTITSRERYGGILALIII